MTYARSVGYEFHTGCRRGVGPGSAPRHFFPLSSINIREARLGRDDKGGVVEGDNGGVDKGNNGGVVELEHCVRT